MSSNKYFSEYDNYDVFLELPNCYPLKVFADGLKLSGSTQVEFRFYPAGMIIYSCDNIDRKVSTQIKMNQHHAIEIQYTDMSKYYFLMNKNNTEEKKHMGDSYRYKSPRETADKLMIIKTIESVSLQKALKNLNKSDGIRIEILKNDNTISISSNQSSKNGTTNSIKCIENHTDLEITKIEEYTNSEDKIVHSLPSTKFSLSFKGHSAGKNDRVEIKIYDHGKIHLGNVDNDMSTSKSCSKFEESYMNASILEEIRETKENKEPIVKYIIPRNICKLFTKFATMNPHGVVKIYGGISNNGDQLPLRVVNKFGSIADYEFMLIVNDDTEDVDD